MANYVYEARDRSGKRVSGTLTAETRQAALRDLDRQDLLPIELKTVEEAQDGGGWRLTRRIVTTRRLAMLYAQLSDLLNAGVPLLRSLDVLSRQSRKRPALARVLDDVRGHVAGGQSLAEALGHYPGVFPALHVAMVRAGERGGFIEDVFARLATFTERQDEMRSKIIGSLAYPMFLVLVGLLVVIALLVFFVPKFAQFFDPERMELPGMTVVLLAVSTGIREHSMLIIIGLTGTVALVYAALASPRGRRWWDRAKLRFPLLGQVWSLLAVSRFCRILGTLTGAGVAILSSLRIARDSIGNETLAEIVDDAIEAVRAGEPLAVPLGKDGYFPADILDMISVAEQSNTLDTVLVNVAESTERRLARSIDTMVRLLEPVLLLIIALLVFVVAFSLLMPIFNLSSGVM